MNYNKYRFFWHEVFSQWYPCEFMIDDKAYSLTMKKRVNE